jgi:hypothetical protein
MPRPDVSPSHERQETSARGPAPSLRGRRLDSDNFVLSEQVSLSQSEPRVTLSPWAAQGGFPIVKTAPLPAGAQFLNVIESVFSGMAKGIIHNSDYPSAEAAKDAIDRYFNERNAFFVRCPKRAGRKIWGHERVPSEFSEANNCKDPLYR